MENKRISLHEFWRIQEGHINAFRNAYEIGYQNVGKESFPVDQTYSAWLNSLENYTRLVSVFNPSVYLGR